MIQQSYDTRKVWPNMGVSSVFFKRKQLVLNDFQADTFIKNVTNNIHCVEHCKQKFLVTQLLSNNWNYIEDAIGSWKHRLNIG